MTSRWLPIGVLLLGFGVPGLAGATRITVTTTADDLLANGNCTLREALAAANTDAVVDRCPAGNGHDTIVVPPGHYRLSLTGPGEDAGRTGDLDVAADLTLTGAGAGATVLDGGSGEWPDADRVLHVLPGRLLMLWHVTVRGGVCRNGAGIFNDGTLVLRDSDVRDNVTRSDVTCGEIGRGGGAGVFNRNWTTIARVSLRWNTAAIDTQDENGGGLLNEGTAFIDDTRVTDNVGAVGGGIMNVGHLRLGTTEVGRNRARFWGAGLTNRGGTMDVARSTIHGNVDGGIVNESGSLVIRNSTISGNLSARLAGAVINRDGTAVVAWSTIAANTSVVSPPCDEAPCRPPVAGVSGPMHVTRSIIANAGFGDCWAPVESGGGNIDGDGSCGLAAGDDQPAVDPRLGPLADNGGPTPTHAPRSDSPAIDRITAPCGLAIDQRGLARPQPERKGAACDVGAVEFSPSGEIRLLIDEVQAAGTAKVVAQPVVDALLAALKPAWTDATAGAPASACTHLEGFAAEVAILASQGEIPSAITTAWLDDAARIPGQLCP